MVNAKREKCMSPSRSPLERDQVWVIGEGFLREISLMKFKQGLQYQNRPLPKFSADFHVLKCPECHENKGSGEGICFTYLSKKVLNKDGQVRIRCCDKRGGKAFRSGATAWAKVQRQEEPGTSQEQEGQYDWNIV